jgi:uncharacterized repeat protein (TIGR01451 family)
VLLGQSGTADVLVGYEDTDTGVRTVSQNVLVVNGSSTEESIAERRRLFLNAVWWLLHKPLCGLTDLAISQSASADPASTGEALTYTLTVQRSGECQGTGVTVTHVLPANVKFVTAESPQGTWSESNGVVTFHLGLLEGVMIELTVTVTPVKPGPAVSTVRVRGNEREQNLNNNTSTLTVQVDGVALAQAAASVANGGTVSLPSVQSILSLTALPGGLIELAFVGELGGRYVVETSTDLVTWTSLAEFVSSDRAITIADRPTTSVQFYRVLRR